MNAVGACGWMAMLAAEPAHQNQVTAPVSNESFKALSFVGKDDVMERTRNWNAEELFDKLGLQYSICQHVSPLCILK